MNGFKNIFVITLTTFLLACTTRGELVYEKPNGEKVSGCLTEYSGAPSVDKFIVQKKLKSAGISYPTSLC